MKLMILITLTLTIIGMTGCSSQSLTEEERKELRRQSHFEAKLYPTY